MVADPDVGEVHETAKVVALRLHMTLKGHLELVDDVLEVDADADVPRVSGNVRRPEVDDTHPVHVIGIRPDAWPREQETQGADAREEVFDTCLAAHSLTVPFRARVSGRASGPSAPATSPAGH